MRYFNRTMKMSNVLLGICVVFFFLSIFSFLKGHVGELFAHGFENEPLGTMLFIICFVDFLVTFTLGIALRCIAKDAAEDLGIIEKRFGE